MAQTIVIIGGVAGGASTAARLRRLSEEDQIIVFERGPHVSFSNCCLPYHLSGTVENSDDLVLMSPEKFKAQYNLDMRTGHEVVRIDATAHTVTVRKVETGETFDQSYDKLVLSPGGSPVIPPIPGIENAPIFTIRNVPDIVKLQNAAKGERKRISVVGGGFIGVEAAENLREAGHEVTLIEAMPQIMRIFDEEMVQILHKELHDHGVQLILNDKVTAFEGGNISLASGKNVESDLVVLAIGVRPESSLAKEAGMDLAPNGAIKVDQNHRTSAPDVYAVGDAVEVYHAVTGDFCTLPLAGPAQKQARQAADDIHGLPVDNRGYIGSSCIKVFGFHGSATGVTAGFLRACHPEVRFGEVMVIPGDKVGLMPGCEPLHFKLVYELPTGRILGAQAIGKGNADKRIDVVATAMKFGATVEDLKDLELCYAPPFGTAKDVVNFAGYVATNLRNGSFKQITVDQIRPLVEQGAHIIDVREEDEYALSHIKGAVNIPLSQLRDRISEIPQDKDVYLHCRSAQRSYNAVMALQNLGYTKVYNVSGGFLGLSYYEYFRDVTENRAPVVTNYNFD
ncbi:MAG: FAD-dependent oxidoreductase [Spirochaetales bacterium]|nr:FAD-dependent oxidoreductase [Spirochaetales bacterium]